jgi:hypothetical protein
MAQENSWLCIAMGRSYLLIGDLTLSRHERWQMCVMMVEAGVQCSGLVFYRIPVLYDLYHRYYRRHDGWNFSIGRTLVCY